MSGAQMTRLPDGRLHFNHGPIDLILRAWGPAGAVAAAEARAAARFEGLLDELVAELPALRSAGDLPLHGPVARRMGAAVAPHRPEFVTPMAAVAGAVADEICAVMAGQGDLERAFVNDGGDIAFHLTAGTRFVAAIAGGAGSAGLAAGRVVVRAEEPVRGLATSGWRGRSWSLGIADAVTVLAASAAAADAAATLIANAVDLPGHAAIVRRPAVEMQADSDLGELPVTVAVGPLTPGEVAAALAAGAARARAMLDRGLIGAAALFLSGEACIVGRLSLSPVPEPAVA